MPRISKAWKSYTESGKYFEDLKAQKITVDPVAKRQAVKKFEKKHGRLPTVKGGLDPIKKQGDSRRTHGKNGNGSNGKKSNGKGNGNGMLDFWTQMGILAGRGIPFAPVQLGTLAGLWGGKKAAEDRGQTFNEFAPLLMLPAAEGEAAAQTGEAAASLLPDWKSLLVIGGAALGILYLITRR